MAFLLSGAFCFLVGIAVGRLFPPRCEACEGEAGALAESAARLARGRRP